MPRQRKYAYVEIVNTMPVRIFRSTRAAIAAMAIATVWYIERAGAVADIRKQVFNRADGACERCGLVVPWDIGEMHETLPKGKGGEVSLGNCEWLCHDCHQGKPDSAHGNRRTRFGEVVTDANSPL